MPVLVVRSPGQPDRIVPLEDKAVLVGRGADADLQLEDPKVSTRHLRFRRLDDGSWVAKDLGSTQGTLMGKRRILRTALTFGNILKLGDTRIAFLEKAPDRLQPEPRKTAQISGASAGSERVSSEKSGGEEAGHGKAASEKAGSEKAGSEKAGARKTGDDGSSAVGGTLDLKPIGGTLDLKPVGGTLDLKAVGATLDLTPAAAGDAGAAPSPSRPSSPPLPLQVPPAPPWDPPAALVDEGPPPVITRRIDGKSMSKALALLAAGLLAVLAAQFLLRPKADEARQRARERQELSGTLQRSDISADTFALEVEDFLADHPDAEDKDRLIAYLAAVRAAEADRLRIESSLNHLAGELTDLPESEIRGRLLELQRTLPHDEDVARQAGLALSSLDRRHEAAEAAALEATLRAAGARLERADPAGALRRVAAFRHAWPSPSVGTLDRLGAFEDKALEDANRLAEMAVATAEALDDPVERRRTLAAAWRGLAGMHQADLVADALRFTHGPGGASGAGTARPTASGSTPTPETPEIDESILAEAAAAEQLVNERRWPQALTAFETLIEKSNPGVLRSEWLTRFEEIRHVLGLVDALTKRTKGAEPPRIKLSTGRMTVLNADDEGVEMERGGERTRRTWAQVPTEDLVPLLKPSRPTPEQRFGLAVLAASVSDRDGVVQALAPLLEKEASVEEASTYIARYLFGRASPPPGGYRVHRGEILDTEGYERRLRQEKVSSLREQAEGALARMAGESAFKKLEKLKAMRAELDKRRRYALLAIFNEKHYPYPYDRASEQYRSVQKEVDVRVASVREIWDDEYKVKITLKGSLGKQLGKWNESLAEMKKLGEDVSDLEAQIAPYVGYLTGEPVTIRDYYLNDSERRLLAYNRWVMQEYNPEQDREATQPERLQTHITNEYRMMLGYAAVVTPGAAPYAGIDSENVAKILDEGTIERLVPTRAVRVEDRLVRSARSHSLDMQKRGFFNHHAPPNPATGEPRTSPFDRMQRAGYKGGGASENIHRGSGSPLGAHESWCHSSGHHRNLLSPWHDLGVGQAGKFWTQNFGSGGGRAPVIEREAPTTPPADGKDKDRRGRSGGAGDSDR